MKIDSLKKNVAKIILIVFSIGMIDCSISDVSVVKAAESTSENVAVKEELRKMLLSGDLSEHDISAYHLSGTQLNNIFQELIQKDCKIAYFTYGFCHIGITDYGKYVNKFELYTDETNFSSDYAKITGAITSIMSGVTSDMTSSEKALYLHDTLLKIARYSTSGVNACYGKNIFINGSGVCSAYSEAYMFLLNEAGIESAPVVSVAMDHEWVYVNLDGNWYHVDPTWDDKGNVTKHTYFLLNDEEAENSSDRKHYDWTIANDQSLVATSTIYSNSYLHDVTGQIYYYNGREYYANGNQILSNNAAGEDLKIESTAEGDVSLTGINNGVLSYKCNNVTSQLEVNAKPELVGNVTTSKTVQGTDAEFYLVKDGGSRTNYSTSNYYSVGKGKIATAEIMSTDLAKISANIVSLPDVSQHVKTGYKIEWYSIKKAGGAWHVDGQIVPDTTAVEIQKSVTDGEAAVSANFYLVKEGGSRTNYCTTNYYSLGTGTIKNAVNIQNNYDAVAENLGIIPDTSTYLTANKKIEWYSIKMAGGAWHVDGQIVDDDVAVVTQNQAESTAETLANYYLVKEGGDRTNLSVSNYNSIGTGTIKQAKTIQNDNDAIVANLGTVPDVSAYLKNGYKVEWYSIKKAGRVWHVDGQIVEDTSCSIADNKTAEQLEDTADTEATYLLIKEGESRTDSNKADYYNIGKGTIIGAKIIQDDTNAVNAQLGTVPDASVYIMGSKHIVWYSIESDDGMWYVKGEFIDDTVTESSEAQKTANNDADNDTGSGSDTIVSRESAEAEDAEKQSQKETTAIVTESDTAVTTPDTGSAENKANN